ncbi:MAG: hypothetical protein ACOYXC_20945 [Candidatus Rifleibacteriota bacterium]
MALFLFFGGFIKYSSGRRHATGKLNKAYLARELSYSVATLAVHHLKEIEIKKTDSELFRQLSLPLEQMKDQISGEIQFTADLANIQQKLLAGSSGLKNLSCQVSWRLQKNGFENLIKSYPREKAGHILIPVVITYQQPGTTGTVSEDYLYSARIKVAANIIPVLSRFSLYVKDAVCGEGDDRFNKVHTDMYGNLKGSTFRPWVFDNGNVNSSSFPSRFSEVIEAPIGLIYLGGGKIVLGNCRGWNIAGKYGEGFHLLAEGRGDGLYTVGFINQLALMNWETGLCDDVSDDSARYWWEMIKDGYDDMSRRNSMLRLLGTDMLRSPTIVFGDVHSRTFCAKAFKEGNDFFGPLPYVNTQDRFTDICSGGSEDFDIGYFKSVVGNISRSEYNSEYASCLMEVPFNRALSYIITNHKNAKPMKSGIIPESDPLFDFIEGKAVAKGVAEKIPAPYSTIYSDVSDLGDMKKMLEKIGVPGDRALKTIELAKGEKLLDRLKKEGFLRQNQLDINGWLHVKSEEKILIDQALLLASHGGIVFEKGNIELRSSVGGTGCLLHLVTLDGNIEVDESIGGELHVSLIAAGSGSDSGQVKFPGSINSNLPIIRGNIAMQRLAKGSLSSSAARGVEIKYRKELAALPGKTAENMSEKALLMFGIDPDPELVE